MSVSPLSPATIRGTLLSGIAYYYFTTLLVLVGVLLSLGLIKPQRDISAIYPAPLAQALSWDGLEYARIADRGYFYESNRPSNVAFFPAFPLAGRWFSWMTGSGNAISLLMVAHLCLVGAFLLLHRYVRLRFREQNPTHCDLVLLALGLWPTTMFFRMAYSESLFLLVAVGAMYAMQRRAHPLWIALIVGLGTATRPVGVALLGPFALYLWEQTRKAQILGGAHNDPLGLDGSAALTPALSQGEREHKRHWLRFLRSAALWMPVACWGIGGYMLFQYTAFGEPLAFFHTQEHWGKRPHTPYLEQWGRALILEPIWSVYDPSSIAYWARRQDDPQNPLFSLRFANPIYFVLSAFLVWLGWRKRWLNGKEVLLAALLLGIPYFTHSYRHLMLSQGRFAAVVFPVYIVMGRLMARAPAWLVAVLCALSGFLLAVYAALFAAGYRVT